MKYFAEIVKAVAWPITIGIIFFYLRFQMKAVAGALIWKVRSANKIKLRFAGLALEMASQMARRSILPTNKTKTGESDQDEFNRLALEYHDLKIENTDERVVKRFKLADRLGQLAIALDLPRTNLAKGNEGQLVALATAVVLEPKPRDLNALRVAARRVEFKFTAYRIVLTITELAKDLRPANLARLEEMLNDVEENSKSKDDAGLQNLIESTRQTLADLLV